MTTKKGRRSSLTDGHDGAGCFGEERRSEAAIDVVEPEAGFSGAEDDKVGADAVGEAEDGVGWFAVLDKELWRGGTGGSFGHHLVELTGESSGAFGLDGGDLDFVALDEAAA